MILCTVRIAFTPCFGIFRALAFSFVSPEYTRKLGMRQRRVGVLVFVHDYKLADNWFWVEGRYCLTAVKVHPVRCSCKCAIRVCNIASEALFNQIDVTTTMA